MKIGLLAYHSVCNYGAFLQLLSTVEYLKAHGHSPLVINWVPKDLEQTYQRVSIPTVVNMFARERSFYYPLSKLCRTDEDVAEVILKEKIDAVIIGSDAVCQHHPLIERMRFPTRTIIHVSHYTSDRMYPNPFWGTFNKYLNPKVPVAVISASSQDSQFQYIKGQLKRQMKESILEYKYCSVRDDWSQRMVSYLTDGAIIPEVTPDPVFAFNKNAGHLLPSKKDILNRYHLPSKYLLVSFKNGRYISQSWIDDLAELAKQNGMACVKLPYADCKAFGDFSYDVGDCISPLDWYALIKYSCGYIGNNMHPIVVSLHNGVPFFSFDNYGTVKLRGLVTNEKSSKIFHVLTAAGLQENRVFEKSRDYVMPKPNTVINGILNFDLVKEKFFAESYYRKYSVMMEKAISSLQSL